MRPDGQQQDGLGAFVLDELEDDSQIMTGTAGP
jgi:hypothetical protein